VSGQPGDVVGLPVVLHTAGQSVASLQNDIVFDTAAPIRGKQNGQPDCEVNPGIGKDASGFTFLPAGCQPGSTCTTVRALILSTQTSDPIGDGTVAYICRIQIAKDATLGGHPLGCGVTDAASPDHVMLHPGCAEGAVGIISTPRCIGDCMHDSMVTVNEVITMVNIALENRWVGSCLAGDRNGDGEITVNEIIYAIGAALNGCPAGAS
jgi:hypothetical protein